MARKKKSETVTIGNLVRSSTWAGLRLGDPVEISDTGLRSATWEFVAHVKNSATGDESIEVVGGRPGDRMIRSFRPERVFPPKHKKSSERKYQQSLFDAPQLPLG